MTQSHDFATFNPAAQALCVIQKYGWHKYSEGDESVGFCLGGALNHLDGRNGAAWYEPTAEVVATVIEEQYPERYDSGRRFSYFNDHRDTVQTDVERVLEKAALQIDEKVWDVT